LSKGVYCCTTMPIHTLLFELLKLPGNSTLRCCNKLHVDMTYTLITSLVH
jgi:hypothetical protein